jgi:hypothetical protein
MAIASATTMTTAMTSSVDPLITTAAYGGVAERSVKEAFS